MDFLSRIFNTFLKKTTFEEMEGNGEGEGHASVAVLAEAVSLAIKVFGNNLIRDIIVDRAIHQERGGLNRSTICSLRAVGKSWNDSVCKLLHKNRQALFEMHVGGRMILNGVQRRDSRSAFLDQFTETFGRSPDILGRGPTYNVEIYEEYISGDVHQSLLNFLRGCGNGIVKLEARLDWKGGPLSGIFEGIPLPSLQKSIFVFLETNPEQGMGQRESVSNLLECVFSRAPALKELDMANVQVFPSDVFKSVTFPPTLQHIFLQDFGNTDLQKLLIKTRHPNLSKLHVELSHDSLTVGLLERILENFRRSLKFMSIRGHAAHEDGTGDPGIFRFPRMEKLETFELYSNRYHLEPGMPSLENYLPKLQVLRLDDQSSEMLGRWTDFSKFSKVQELYLSSLNVNLNFETETMARVHLAFPNVTTLELEFVEIPASGLQYIFMEMRNLVELRLLVTKWLEPTQYAADWDALLLGIPSELGAGLRAAAPALLEKIQINNDEYPSIRKLTELRSLSIIDRFNTVEHRVSLLSDVAFHFAFLKMAALQELNLFGRFWVSSEMADKWRANGRLLKITG